MNDDKNETVRLAKERNALAEERTFLAWLRTGLAGVAGGVAINRWLLFENTLHHQIAAWIGNILMLWGIAIFILAMYNYVQTAKELNVKRPLWPSMLIASTLMLLAIAMFFITIR